MAAHDQLAQSRVLAAEPQDAWWEQCKSGADTTAALIERGISLSVPRWLRQWLELVHFARANESILSQRR